VNAHAPLPPSGAKRWTACPGSVAAERVAPKQTASVFAEIGTLGHALFARCMVERLPATAATTDPELVRPLALALELTRQILSDRRFMVELRLPPLAGLPTVWGTSDLVGFTAAGPLELILDLKFGEALRVEPDDLQLGIYTLLAARRFGCAPSGVDTWVIQPRHDHDSGPARRHHYSPADLDALEVQVRAAAAATELPDAPRCAGPWCRWCTAAGDCPTRREAPSAVPSMPSAFFRPQPRWFARRQG
jgi:hypothetical protein